MLQEFVQKIEETTRDMINEIHTALPGKIVSFDPNTGTATVKPSGKYILSNGKKLDYPVITEVPVLFPYCQSVGIGLLFPVKKDDNCLLIVSELELDEWRSGAESEASLRFDLTSAVAIPGLLLGGKEISKEYHPHAVVIRAGRIAIHVSENEIVCYGDLKIEGNLYCTGEVKAGTIGLRNHTHVSASEGERTSTSQSQ